MEILTQWLLGSMVKTLWEQLDPLQQKAVSETVHSDSGLFFADQFLAKYGEAPKFLREKKQSGGSYQSPSLLALFLYGNGKLGSGRTYIPGDLHASLLSFVPKPPSAELKCSASCPPDGLVQRFGQEAAIQDLRTLLRLIEQEKILVSATTKHPSKATQNLLRELLHQGDFYQEPSSKNKYEQEIGSIKAFSWPLLVQVGKYARTGKGKLELTPSGRAALDRPAEESLKVLWKSWIENQTIDEFRRIETVKGQTGRGKAGFTSPSYRRKRIVDALAQCPVGKWIDYDEFSRFIQAAGLSFSVHTNLWDLYFSEAQYGSLGYDGLGSWNILEDRYILCLLFEYAAPLGLIDLAYENPRGSRANYRDHWGADHFEFLSRYDGLRYFRLTPLGAYILGVATGFQAQVVDRKLTLNLHPNGTIDLVEGSLAPDEAIQMDLFTDQVSDHQWSFNEAKTLKALEKGANLEKFQNFLTAHDPQTLPEKLEGIFKALQEKAHACSLKGTCLLLECFTSDIAEILAEHPQTKNLCQRVGVKGLVIPVDKENRFRTALNKLGYGMPLV